jgi:hypothetical protein
MAKGMEEEWEDDSFSRRFFYICRMLGNPFEDFKKELDKTFAQFISFIVEGAKARQTTFENMGVPKERPQLESPSDS